MGSKCGSAPTSKDVTAEITDDERPLRRSKRLMVESSLTLPGPISRTESISDHKSNERSKPSGKGLMSSMDSKRSSASISKDITAEEGPLRTSKRLKTPSGTISRTSTEHSSASERSKQEGIRLQGLPLDITNLVSDYLDTVARSCLELALGCWPKNDPGTLSPCAKPRLAVLLRRDGPLIPQGLLEAARYSPLQARCSEYEAVSPVHCSICRCDGHLSYCPGCGVSTCARQDAEFWQKWTRTMNGDKPS